MRRCEDHADAIALRSAGRRADRPRRWRGDAATSDDIDALVLDDEADVPALKGWRRKLFGEKALAIKHGRIALAATRKGVIEVEIPGT